MGPVNPKNSLRQVDSRVVYLLLLAIWVTALWRLLDWAGSSPRSVEAVPIKEVNWVDFFHNNILSRLPEADTFVTPLRPPDGKGAYVTRPFLDEGHLGEDWATKDHNGTLGEPVYSIGDGWVAVAYDFENAWGKVIFIDYKLPPNRYPAVAEVMYAELGEINIMPGDFVKKGQKIGTVGTANGIYQAHLHWEVRQDVGYGLGNGFDSNRDGWLGPSEFLEAHRNGRPLFVKMLAPAERKGWPTEQ